MARLQCCVLRACGPHGPIMDLQQVMDPELVWRLPFGEGHVPPGVPLGARRVWEATRPSCPAARVRPLVGPPTPTALCGVDEPAGARSLTVPPPELGTVTGPEAVDRAVRHRRERSRPSCPTARARPSGGPPTPTALYGVDEPAGAPPLTVPPPELGTVTGLEAVDCAVQRRRERSQQKAALVAPAAGDGADRCASSDTGLSVLLREGRCAA